MKNWILFFALTIALTNAACTKKDSTFFEDSGKKLDQVIHNAGENIDKGLNKAGEKVKNATR